MKKSSLTLLTLFLLSSAFGLYSKNKLTHKERQLFSSIYRGNFKKITKLLSQGTNPNARNFFDRTPLMIAAQYNRSKIILLLLKKDAQINATSCYKETPLMMAAKWGNFQSIKILIRFKANPFMKDRKGRTALDLARRGEQIRRHTKSSGGQHTEYVRWQQTAKHQKSAQLIRQYMDSLKK